MSARDVLFGLALAAVVANIVTLLLIMGALDRRGHKTSVLLARIYTFKYLKMYKEATRKETGKTGPLYGFWILSINLALVFAVAGVLCG